MGEKQKNFSPVVAACFTLNYVIGAGILTIPWAFNKAGLLLTSCVMIVVGILSIISSDYLLSTMARADAITTFNATKKYLESYEHENAIDLAPTSAISSLKSSKETERLIQSYQNSHAISSITDIDTNIDKLSVKDRKFELTELCQLFLGDYGFRIYTTSITLYLYGLLWAYTSVFANAMDRSLPLNQLNEMENFDSYKFYVLLFASVVVPLSLMDLSEQIAIQVSLSVCRLLIIAFIVITPLAASFATLDLDQTHGYFGDQTYPKGAILFQPSGIPKMLPIVVFSCIFHHGIPGLSQEVKRKSALGNIFGITLIICTVAYTIIGIVAAWYFGDGVNESINLNWATYHGPNSGRLASFISAYTVIFPAFDVVSAFPLNALVLSNSLYGAFYELQHSTGVSVKDDIDDEKAPPKQIKYGFRLISCVPPLIGGYFERNLSTITDYTGLLGLLIGFCFPALLYVASERQLQQLNLPSDTLYSRFGSTAKVANFVFVFGLFSIIFNFLQLVLE